MGAPLGPTGEKAVHPSARSQLKYRLSQLEVCQEGLVASLTARLDELTTRCDGFERFLADSPPHAQARRLNDVERLVTRSAARSDNVGDNEAASASRPAPRPLAVKVSNDCDTGSLAVKGWLSSPPSRSPVPANLTRGDGSAVSPRSGWRSNRELELRSAALAVQQASLRQANLAGQVQLQTLEASLQQTQAEIVKLQEQVASLSDEAEALRVLRDQRSTALYGPVPLEATQVARVEDAISFALVSCESSGEEQVKEDWTGGWSGIKWIESSIDCSGIIAKSFMNRLQARLSETGHKQGSQSDSEKSFIAALGGSLDSGAESTIEALLKEDGTLISQIAHAIALKGKQLASDEVEGSGGHGTSPGGAVDEVHTHGEEQSQNLTQGEGGNSLYEVLSRFVDKDSHVLSYAPVASFFRGLSGCVGRPRGLDQVCAARLYFEHCEFLPDSSQPFSASNYDIETTTTIEWSFVVNPEAGHGHLGLSVWPQPRRGINTRHPLPLSHFEHKLEEVNQLLKARDQTPISWNEFISTRLYTGPCFIKYNTVLRSFQATTDANSDAWFRKDRNNFTSTLHCIARTISKLSHLTKATKLYRAPGGAMPKAFMEIDPATGMSGGIECGFMSCTTDFEQARHYALCSPGARMVYEVHQGLVHRGAEISWLSQFPREAECLFPPFSAVSEADSPNSVPTPITGAPSYSPQHTRHLPCLFVLELMVVTKTKSPQLEVVYRTKNQGAPSSAEVLSAAKKGTDEEEPATRVHGSLLVVELRVSVSSDLVYRKIVEEHKDCLALHIIGVAIRRRKQRKVHQAWLGKLQQSAVSRIDYARLSGALEVWGSQLLHRRSLHRRLITAQLRRERNCVKYAWIAWVAKWHTLLDKFQIMRGNVSASLQFNLNRPILAAMASAWRVWAHTTAIRARLNNLHDRWQTQLSSTSQRRAAMRLWRLNVETQNVAIAVAMDVERRLTKAHCIEMEALKQKVAALRSQVHIARTERDTVMCELGKCEDELDATKQIAQKASTPTPPAPPSPRRQPMTRQASRGGSFATF